MKDKYNIIIAIMVFLCVVIIAFLFIGNEESTVNTKPTIYFNGGTIVLKVGESRELKPVVTNLDNYTVSWNSSNTNVAAVNNGYINAIAKGNTNITASLDGYDLSATMVVIVNDIEPTSITLSTNKLELIEGEEARLTYNILPENATNKDVKWEISNENVVSVNNDVVTALTPGVSRVTVRTTNGYVDSCDVLVKSKEVPVEKITFDKNAYTLYIDETVKINATISPDNATDKTLTWTSSDDSIATVNNGLIKGIKKGNVTIKATDSKGLVSMEVNVTINKRIVNIDPREITIIGDSRMVGLCHYDWYKSEGGTCVSKGAMGYNWLRDTAVFEVNRLSPSKKKYIVTNLGVNDLDNVDKYIEKYRELVTGSWKDYHLFVLSVNPTNGTRAGRNTKIESFNAKLKGSLQNYENVTYCDSYSYLKKDGFGSGDGVHYYESTSKKIYQYIKDCIYKYYNE
ncbi:MAG: Ig-like domain-containing protein [Bacilli bacterium]|nr:Ig-like domain-containing protein [Bacilli bacterium]